MIFTNNNAFLKVHCGFFPFPKIKNYLKGHDFNTIENTQEALVRGLHDIPE